MFHSFINISIHSGSKIVYFHSRYAKLRNAKLSYCNLSFCNFERADMTNVEMNCAILSGVRMACATLESAHCSNCNFQVNRITKSYYNLLFIS